MQDNVHVQQNNCGAISIMTISNKMSEVVSVTEQSWPDLFHEGISMFAGKTNTSNTNNRKRLKKNLGLQENEQDILSLINSDINNENLTNIEDEDDTLPDLNGRETTLEAFLLGDECSLLQNILNQLRNFNANKWHDKSKHFLYPHLLTDANEMMKFCIVKELNIIATEMRCIMRRIWFSNSAIKSENVNLIVSAFGGVRIPNQEISRHKRKIFQPDSLVLIASQALRNENFPVEHLQIPLATLIQRENTRKWKENATCNLFAPIPSENDPRIVKPLEYFSYPEFCPVQQQMEPRTFDFTHILTNMRCQILTQGFDFCKKHHFEMLCKERPDILSMALVYDKIDTQNAFTAMKMFRYSVQRWMQQQEFSETAHFIRLVRNWHDACNRRGLSADTRVRYLSEMHEFLTKGMNFNCVPFQYPNRYIRGMTWQTYEALLQNISTRLQLYYLSNSLTYNARSVSTLSNESFFADLVHYDKESHGYPKAVNVCEVFGRVVLINYFKHKRDRNYFLSATVKSKYEVKLAEHNYHRFIRETAYNHSGFYRDNFFDFPNELHSQRVRRDDITTGLSALRTTPGVRVFFRTNEHNILPEICGGRKVKGFSLQ